VSRIRPVYVDGPLEGQEFDTDSAFVNAVKYPNDSGFPLADPAMVTYQVREFGFHVGGKAVLVWIGWCSPDEPDAETVARALFKPEVFERAEARDMPKDLTR
jgi:hypothetical protein